MFDYLVLNKEMDSLREGSFLKKLCFLAGAFSRRQSPVSSVVVVLVMDSWRNTLMYTNATTDIAAATYACSKQLLVIST